MMSTPTTNPTNFLSMFPTYTFDNGVYSTVIGQNEGMKQFELVMPDAQLQTKIIVPQIQESSTSTPPKQKYVNPFAPEATVPLPVELEDQFGPYSSSVWKRNERERCRVRNVNDGYERLRKHLPVHVDEKRISKVDTLRLAIRYIRHLDNLLKNHLHQYNCKCFAGFQEESEGNIAIDVNSFSFGIQGVNTVQHMNVMN